METGARQSPRRSDSDQRGGQPPKGAGQSGAQGVSRRAERKAELEAWRRQHDERTSSGSWRRPEHGVAEEEADCYADIMGRQQHPQAEDVKWWSAPPDFTADGKETRWTKFPWKYPDY